MQAYCGIPRSLEEALYFHGNSRSKKLIATALDQNGKVCGTLTYGKLLRKSLKIAHYLTKGISTNDYHNIQLECGNCVALLYTNNEPISFLCSFYGCLFAGMVPISVDDPSSKSDSGSAETGSLLARLNVKVALTSNNCLQSLPKTVKGEVIHFDGWPKVLWVNSENVPKVPKDGHTIVKYSEESTCYIETTTDRYDNSVLGVLVTRGAILSHCMTLTETCCYNEDEIMVCSSDFKKKVGLWHSVLSSVLNGMHVIFIPHNSIELNPSNWLHTFTKYKATSAVSKLQDLWASVKLFNMKAFHNLDLKSLRFLLIEDCISPQSLPLCKRFYQVFKYYGLQYKAICPCVASALCFTIAVKRPGGPTEEETVLVSSIDYKLKDVGDDCTIKLWNCGTILPGGSAVVVKTEGPPFLCGPNEIGEICFFSESIGCFTDPIENTSVIPLQADGFVMTDTVFTRSGFLGVLKGNFLYPCGRLKNLVIANGQEQNFDVISSIILSVDPVKFDNPGGIVVFSVTVLQVERICIIIEEYLGYNEEENFRWMTQVVDTINSKCQVSLYCIGVVPSCYLPKNSFDRIQAAECKKRFLNGTLNLVNVLVCPEKCLNSAENPAEELYSSVDPASDMVGNYDQQNNLASASRAALLPLRQNKEMEKKYILEILEWQSRVNTNTVLCTQLNSNGSVYGSLTFGQLYKHAQRIGSLLLINANICSGDRVALVIPPGIELICAVYGCFYVGAVPVPVKPPILANLYPTLATVRTIVKACDPVAVLSTRQVIKVLKSEDGTEEQEPWPLILDMSDSVKTLIGRYRAPTDEILAYLDFSISSTGNLTGVKMSHRELTSLCRSLKMACELYLSREIVLCLEPYSGLGFALSCLCSVHSGLHSIIIPPSEIEENPAFWITTVSQYKVRDTYCSYRVVESCTKLFKNSIDALKSKDISLSLVRTCIIVAEEKPRVELTAIFCQLFQAIGLNPRAVSTSFGCRVNPAICLQSAADPEPSSVYVDVRALSHDKISLVEKGSPHAICFSESGKLLPGVHVVVVNPVTEEQCSLSEVGEIWVKSSHNISGYFFPTNGELFDERHLGRLANGNSDEVFARTGYLGFLKKTISHLNSKYTSLFIVGSIEEMIMLRGMKYHPSDIEHEILKCHPNISECVTFVCLNKLVVVAELVGDSYSAVDLIPLITSTVLEELQLAVGVIVIVDPNIDPVTSFGEKHRMHVMDDFLSHRLDPVYVAYNL